MTEKNYDIGDVELKDVILTNFSGTSIDITKLFTNMYIQEDIFAPVTVGEIALIDKDALIEKFPIIGNETISITYRTYKSFNWVTRSFFVYSITNQRKLNDNAVMFSLNFTTKEYLLSNSMKLSKSFNNMSPCSIVDSILKNTLGSTKDSNIEESMGIMNYIAPNLTPMQVISVMCSRAKSKVNPGGASYMFYEDVKGFNFRTLEGLYKNKPFNYTATVSTLSNDSSLNTLFTVLAVHFDTSVSAASSVSTGALGVKALSLDLYNKKLKDVSYNHNDDKHYTKLNRVTGQDPSLKCVPNNFAFKSEVGLKKFFISPSSVDSASFKDENTSIRYSQLATIATGPKVSLEVVLNSNLTVGSMINLKVMTMKGSESSTEVDMEDAFNSGLYLVTCCRHIFKSFGGRASGTTALELSRDTYNNSHDELVKKNNKGIGL